MNITLPRMCMNGQLSFACRNTVCEYNLEIEKNSGWIRNASEVVFRFCAFPLGTMLKGGVMSGVVQVFKQ